MVFILLGRYKKTTMGNNHPPLAVLGVGMSKIRARLDLVSGEVLLLVVFRLRPAWRKGEAASWAVPFGKGSYLIHSGTHSGGAASHPGSLQAAFPRRNPGRRHIWPITMGAAQGNLKIRNILNAWGAGKNRLVLVEELTSVLIGFSYL